MNIARGAIIDLFIQKNVHTKIESKPITKIPKGLTAGRLANSTADTTYAVMTSGVQLWSDFVADPGKEETL